MSVCLLTLLLAALVQDVYTSAELQVPWLACLGNHDYHHNPQVCHNLVPCLRPTDGLVMQHVAGSLLCDRRRSTTRRRARTGAGSWTSEPQPAAHWSQVVRF